MVRIGGHYDSTEMPKNFAYFYPKCQISWFLAKNKKKGSTQKNDSKMIDYS